MIAGGVRAHDPLNEGSADDSFNSVIAKDDEFVRRLHADLQDKGVRCWFAPHDMKIGAKILDTLDEAIHPRDKVLLVLSEASIASDWVEDEVTKAFPEERQRGGVVLFSVRLERGIAAARLHAIKADITAHLGDCDLTATAVAQRQHITPRYVHKVLELEGTTFSTFVLARRLSLAYRLLSDGRLRHRHISSVAFEVGFGDLSYFNRAFRRSYGATPSEVRQSSEGSYTVRE